MLMVEVDEKGHLDRDLDYKKKIQKELRSCAYHFARINPGEKNLMITKNLVKKQVFVDKLKTEELKKLKIIKELKKENEEFRKEKNSLRDKVSKRLLGLKFEKYNSIKNKAHKMDCQKKCCQQYKNEQSKSSKEKKYLLLSL